MRPLLYLEFLSIKNAIIYSARSPKRIIPVVIIGLYMVSSFVSAIVMAASGGAPGSMRTQQFIVNIIDYVEPGIFLALSLIALAFIYSAFGTSNMFFSLANIDFLFPAPVAKRDVLILKLIKDYIKYGAGILIVFFALSWVFMSMSGSDFFPTVVYAFIAVTAFVILSVNIAHIVNLVFTMGYRRLAKLGTVLKLGVLAAIIALVIFGVSQFVVEGVEFASLTDTLAANTILLPAKWTAMVLVSPMTTFGGAEKQALIFTIIASVVSFALVVMRNENVYEPSIEISTKRARIINAIRSGDTSAVRAEKMRNRKAGKGFGLGIPPFGRGAIAFLWKHLVVRYRVSSAQIVLGVALMAGIAYVLGIIFQSPPKGIRIIYVVFYLGAFFSFLFQGYFRDELRHVNTTMAMPVKGWKIILVEVLAFTFYVFAGSCLFGFFIWYFVPGTELIRIAGSLVIVFFLSLAVVPASALASIIYPRATDFAQTILMNMVSLLLFAVALLPGILMAILLYAFIKPGLWHTVVAVSAVYFIVGLVGVILCGKAFEKFDPTDN